jgi:hypothetical protein
MKTILAMLKKIFSHNHTGDLSQHRLHTLRYEDLCK